MNPRPARRRGPLALFFVVVAICLVLIAPGGRGVPAAAAQTPGLQNPGFENNLASWTVVSKPDAVVAVGTEGPAQFATYGSAPGAPITVAPFQGSKMLRLGTPKDISQSQNRGANAVSQTFISDSSTLRIAFWLFSWESRGNDNFGFNLTDATGAATVGTLAPFSFTKNGVTMGCSALPCNITPNTGGAKGAFLNSGWQKVTIANVPVGQQLKLTFQTAGTTNNSFATWAYFDRGNLPPVAKFSMQCAVVDLGAPGSGTPSTAAPQQFSCPYTAGGAGDYRAGPVEGAPIQFVDLSTDPDSTNPPENDNDIVAWEWTITGPASAQLPGGSVTVRTKNPFFIPPDNGLYSVTLKVTDSMGESNSVTSGGTATDGTVIPAVNVVNAPPLANALNIEALAGTTVNLAGRFSDAGWLDSHTALWTVTGLSCTTATLQEDNVAALGTGIVGGTCSVPPSGPSSYTGILTVIDNGGASRSDNFTITVLSSVPSSEDADDAIGLSTPVRTTDGSYLSAIAAAEDKDYFEVRWPGSNPAQPQLLPAGSEVVASLKGLPADYDLVLVAVPPPTAGYAFSGYAFSGYAFSGYAFSGYAFSELPSLVNPNTAGYAFSALERSSYAESGYAFSGYAFSGYAFSGYAFSGYAFSGYAFSPFDVNGYAFSPISQFGFSGLDRSDISATDIRLAELALGNLPEGAKVVGFSANRGLEDEAVFARIDVPGTKLYAIVVGANGAFSAEPYRLELEASMPLSVAAFNSTAGGSQLGTSNVCNADRNFPHSTALPSTIFSVSSPKTLFVTQRERIQSLYGSAEWTALEGSLTSLAGQGAVAGKIISLPSSLYQNWDENPCSIDAANATAASVRAAIQAELTAPGAAYDYVVVVGDDDVVPFRRVPDETVISNERYYLVNSFLKPGTPLFASVQGGFNLSDDYYVDFVPTPWQGRELYVPDLAIGRLVETPAEIKAQADAYVASGGQLSASTAVVAGYDFFADGAAAIGERIGLSFRDLINDTWSADQLRCQWLGVGTNCPAPADVAAPNAHFTHYAGLSAAGFEALKLNPNAPADVITSTDVKNAGTGSALLRRIVFTIGCHAGFNAPDGSTEAADATLGIDSKLDFAQAMAQQRAVYIASTGFGLGDDQGLGGTEQLLVIFSEELLKSGATSGQALLHAKQRYLGGLPAMSVYDEKSSTQTVHYGLPMYRVFANQPLVAALTASVPAGPFPVSTSFSLVTTPDGSYWRANDGDAAAPAYRPLQPRKVFENVTGPGEASTPIHGILLRGGDFTDTPNFNPVIVRPSMEWEAATAEPQVCLPSFWPSELARVNTLFTPAGPQQTLVVTPGQFRCDSDTAPGVKGTQRLFNNLNFEVLRSASEDTLAPVITTVDFQKQADGTIRVSVGATDPAGPAPNNNPSGVSRVVVLRVGAGVVATAADVTFPTPAVSGTFAANIPNPAGDTLIIQVVDAAGNVSSYTGKGANVRFIDVDAGPDQLFADGIPTTFPVSLTGALTYPVTYFMDFGDGSTTSGRLSSGSSFSVSHQYAGAGAQYTARLRVTDANGGIGSDEVVVRQCYDPVDVSYAGSTQDPAPADYTGCAISSDPGTITITLKTLGSLANANENDYSYRLYVNLAGNLTVYQMKYRNGQVNGPTGLTVSFPADNTIAFTFPKSAIVGWTPGQALEFWAETRGGIKATESAGSIDLMPDIGMYSFTPVP